MGKAELSPIEEAVRNIFHACMINMNGFSYKLAFFSGFQKQECFFIISVSLYTILF